MSVPNPENFCGGAFDNWLEVMLYEKCDGACAWCVEKDGFKPEARVGYSTLAKLIREDRAESVILLGGEPTLYPDLKPLLRETRDDKAMYLTTNGTRFNAEFVAGTLDGLAGINVSIHDSDLGRNQKITGIVLDQETLEWAVVELRRRGIKVRFNCNIILGHVADELAVHKYLAWAKDTGVWSVRFSELKNDAERFVSLAPMFEHAHGLNENPFVEGCNKSAVIDGVAVNFRQMCGLQTPMRGWPKVARAPHDKRVLYYDGRYYDGWQTSQRM